jgi:hypothetical protein
MVLYRNQRQHSPRQQTTPEDEIKKKREAYNKAREDLKEAVLANSKPKTNRAELTGTGKTMLRSAGKLVDGFFDANARISDSVERDIRRHSIEGQIDQTMIRAIFENNKTSPKGSTSTKGTSSRRKQQYIIYEDDKGVLHKLPKSSIKSPLGRRR